MSNKALAILGIFAYILSVLTSAQDLEGNFISPPWLILLSAIFLVSFFVLALKRLWKFKIESRVFLISSIVLFIFQTIQETTSPSYGSFIIILTNIARIAYFFIYLWIIIFLWKLDTLEKREYKPEDEVSSLKDPEKKVYIAVPAEKILKKPLSLGVVFVIIFLFFEGIVEFFYFNRQPFPNLHIIWAVLSIIGAIGLLLQTLWGYRVTQAMMIINIVTTPLFIFLPDAAFSSRIVGLIFICLSGLILWYLSRENIKEQFFKPILTSGDEK